MATTLGIGNTILLGLKIKKSNKKMVKIIGFWVYLQKRRTPFLGLKIKKGNKKMAKTIGFWVYLQKKKNPYSWVTECRKTTKYSKSGNPLDKPTKTLYFWVTTRSKPMVSKIFLPSINSLRITTKSNLGVQIL
uniref:Uncharacterized protein n=1 Tax=Acrobeloides nanus TaxID=290746 RepID=A0A914BVV5_9BILA